MFLMAFDNPNGGSSLCDAYYAAYVNDSVQSTSLCGCTRAVSADVVWHIWRLSSMLQKADVPQSNLQPSVEL